MAPLDPFRGNTPDKTSTITIIAVFGIIAATCILVVLYNVFSTRRQRRRTGDGDESSSKDSFELQESWPGTQPLLNNRSSNRSNSNSSSEQFTPGSLLHQWSEHQERIARQSSRISPSQLRVGGYSVAPPEPALPRYPGRGRYPGSSFHMVPPQPPVLRPQFDRPNPYERGGWLDQVPSFAPLPEPVQNYNRRNSFWTAGPPPPPYSSTRAASEGDSRISTATPRGPGTRVYTSGHYGRPRSHTVKFGSPQPFFTP